MKNILCGKIFILFLFLSLTLLFHNFGYIGHYGYDDMLYAKMAVDFQQGTVDYEDHFSYRAPVVLLSTLSYSIFGISDFASSIPPIFITFCILIILFLLVKNKDWKIIVISFSITTFSTWFIFWSDKLSADIYVTFFIFTTLAILHKYKFSSSKKHAFLFATLFTISLFFAFLDKETVILVAPLVIDVNTDKETKIWQGFPINKFIKAYSNWWLAKCETEINCSEIPKNSFLKVYVWNSDGKEGYIDNFGIKLFKK